MKARWSLKNCRRSFVILRLMPVNCLCARSWPGHTARGNRQNPKVRPNPAPAICQQMRGL